MRYLLLLLTITSLSGCCYGILCEGCDPAPFEIAVKFDTSHQNGFVRNELDSLKIITKYPTHPADTSIVLADYFKYNTNTYVLSFNDVSEFRIIQKDSLFDKVISNFTYEIVNVDEGGCCNCGDYAVLKTFDVNGQTISGIYYTITKK